MTSVKTSVLDRLQIAAQELMAAHPPQWRNALKQVAFDISSPPGAVHSGRLDYSRWAAMPLPSRVDPGAAGARLRDRPGFYDYGPTAAGAVEWHVNFADPRLFGYYSGSLFAQDEMQVVEHPALGSLREALVERGVEPLTVERGKPTPVLVMGVERRCSVATEPDPDEGRPHGLYGNEFAVASADAIRRATRRIEPPTRTNLICIAAPHGARGDYTRGEIEHVLVTAYTGFRAAALESARVRGDGVAGATIVHTGWWGCGAFGGNRVLMAVLQLLAAEMAGVEQLVVHSGWPEDSASLDRAVRVIGGMAGVLETGALIDRLVGMRFAWGEGNGT